MRYGGHPGVKVSRYLLEDLGADAAARYVRGLLRDSGVYRVKSGVITVEEDLSTERFRFTPKFNAYYWTGRV